MKLRKTLLSVFLVITLLFSISTVAFGGFFDNLFGGGEEDVIKVGIFAPLSGGNAMVGQSYLDGAGLYFDQINEDGGVLGKKIEVISEDGESIPDKAVSAVNKLVHQDEVDFVLGTVNSSCTLAAMQVTKRAKVPHITAISSNPKITQTNDWIVRLQATDEQQARGLVKYYKEKLGVETIGIIHQSDDYGTGGMEQTKKAADEFGVDVLGVEEYNPGDKDMTSQLLSLKKEAPEALVIYGMYSEAALICKQLDQIDWDPIKGGCGGLTDPKLVELAGDSAKGLVNTRAFYASENAPKRIQKFVEAFKEKYGEVPNENDALAYDTAGVLVQAIRDAGELDNEKVMENLRNVKDYPGVTGMITMNKWGDALRDITIVEVADVKDGDIPVYKQVWPE